MQQIGLSYCYRVVINFITIMEKKEVKFVRLFPTDGKKLKVVKNIGGDTCDIYCDDGYIMPEDELIEMCDVDKEEWEEGRKGYGCCLLTF